MTLSGAVTLGIVLALGVARGPLLAAAGEWPATVVTVGGAAEALRQGGSAWARVELRDELAEGDTVRTGATTRLGLKTAGGHGLRLGPGTRLTLQADGAGSGGRAPRVRMTGGWLWAAGLPAAGSRSQLDIGVGPVTVGLVRGGAAIRVNRDGSVLVRVHHGAVMCSGPGDRRDWERPVSEQQELAVPTTGAPGAARPLTPERIEVEWVKWNEDQDRAGGYGARAERQCAEVSCPARRPDGRTANGPRMRHAPDPDVHRWTSRSRSIKAGGPLSRTPSGFFSGRRLARPLHT